MLYSAVQPYSSVSIIGMCKNAGKTTVLNRIIREAELRGETLGLTSIGRDGERSDLVTNTKKPEIFVRSGAVIATAEQALGLGTISREIVGTTDMPTPMGEIVLARAMSDGFVQLAGPSMTVQLIRVRDILFEMGAVRVLLDGALGRRSLAAPAVSDGAILCTGASYSPDMTRTAEETAYAARLMSLPRTEFPFVASAGRGIGHASRPVDGVRTDDGNVSSGGALANESRVSDGGVRANDCKVSIFVDGRSRPCVDVRDAVDAVRKGGVNAVFIRGGVTDSTAAMLMAAGRALRGMELVCEDGSRLLLSGQNAEKLERAGIGFTVLNTTRLLAVTVNPFSAYGNHYDKDAFMAAVRARIPSEIPVLDVLSD